MSIVGAYSSDLNDTYYLKIAWADEPSGTFSGQFSSGARANFEAVSGGFHFYNDRTEIQFTVPSTKQQWTLRSNLPPRNFDTWTSNNGPAFTLQDSSSGTGYLSS
jgi:hypothetical protein